MQEEALSYICEHGEKVAEHLNKGHTPGQSIEKVLRDGGFDLLQVNVGDILALFV